MGLFALCAGEFLGFKYYLPPYLAPSTKGSAILNGVNYASGSAGILNSSGYLFVRKFQLWKSKALVINFQDFGIISAPQGIE